jgi:AraC-like DNA-binding protein
MDTLALVLASLGVAQAILLCVYLLITQQGKRLANILLAIALFGLSIRIGKSIFNHFYEIAAWQRNLGLMGYLLVGPAFWLYGKALFTDKSLLTVKDLMHFLPSLIYLLFCWVIPNSYTLAASMSYAMVCLQLAVYLAFSYQILLASTQHASPMTRKWFLGLCVGLSLIWLFYVLVFVRLVPYYLGGALSYTVLIYGLSLFFLVRNPIVKISQLKQTKNRIKCIDNAKALELKNRTRSLLMEQKLYLDPALELNSLANALNCSPRELSQVINQHEGMNFTQYINQFRIEYAKPLLLEARQGKPAKISGVASDSGFGNLTSFNQAFKAITGLTPSAYRQQH